MKAPFRFRLERVHSLRVQAERDAQEDLASSLGRRRDGELTLQGIETRIEAAQADSRRALAGGASGATGSDLRGVDAYLERLGGRRASAVRELRESEAEVDERRRALLAAARERQALDRLRGRRRDEHERAAARAEGAKLDELALAVYRRRERAA